MKPADWFVERFGLEPPGRLEGPVDRGYLGQVWRLRCGSQTYAIKESLVPLDHDQVVVAYALQTSAAALGVLAPRQLLTVDEAPAVYVDGVTLRVFEWLDLAAPNRELDPEAVGRLLARLHRTSDLSDSDQAEVDGWYVDPVGEDRWVELVAELRLAGAPFEDDLAALLPELLASESIMERPRDVIICHRDLWADNVRDSPRGPVVIDWDNCGPASASGELATVLAEYGTSSDRAAALYRAYRAAGGPATISRLADFTMPLAVLHHLVELGAKQWLSATDEPARQRAEGRVREFTDDPFGLVQAQAMLAALRS